MPAAGSTTPFSGYDFSGFKHGTISGRVLDENDGPMSGVTVTATPAGGGDAADDATTGRTGSYSLSVPFGGYEVTAEKEGYSFGAAQIVNVAPSLPTDAKDFEATGTVQAVGVMAMRTVVDGAYERQTLPSRGRLAALVQPMLCLHGGGVCPGCSCCSRCCCGDVCCGRRGLGRGYGLDYGDWRRS